MNSWEMNSPALSEWKCPSVRTGRSARSPNFALKEAMKRLILVLRSLLRRIGYTNLKREWSSTSTTA